MKFTVHTQFMLDQQHREPDLLYFNVLPVNVCSPGPRRDPGFQSIPNTSRVLTPICAAPLW